VMIDRRPGLLVFFRAGERLIRRRPFLVEEA
jgi:hypothetical protein